MSTPGRVQTDTWVIGYIPKKYPVGFFGVDPPKNPPRLKSNLIGVEDGGQGGMCSPPPKKNPEKYFSGNFYVNSGIFGQKSCKIREFCSFFGQISYKFGYFANFSGKNHVKFGHFVNFSYIYIYIFWGKNAFPLKLSELICLCPILFFVPLNEILCFKSF